MSATLNQSYLPPEQLVPVKLAVVFKGQSKGQVPEHKRCRAQTPLPLQLLHDHAVHELQLLGTPDIGGRGGMKHNNSIYIKFSLRALFIL